MGYTEEDCIESLREAERRLDETPSKRQYADLGLRPSVSSVKRIMGGWNAAKEAAGLDVLSSGDRYNNPVAPKPDGIDIPEGASWESLSPQQRWYYANREHRIAVKEDRRRALHRWLRQYKARNCACERCGEESSATLVFHHLDEKLGNISKLVNDGVGRHRIMEEIEKCEVLCANCHWIVHHPSHNELEALNNEFTEETWKAFNAKRARRGRLRQWVFTHKARSEGCIYCGEEDSRCLEFHHSDPESKDHTVGQMISDGYQLRKIRREIAKCEIVCRNCHREIHYGTGTH